MAKKQITIFIIIVVAVGGGAFYGGLTYGQTLRRSPNAARFNGQGGQFPGGRGGGMLNGEITGKDAKGLTIKQRDGSSKSVLFSSNTQVSKPSNVTLEDLVIGENVVVTGSPNLDGTINAQNIQIRSASSTPPLAPAGTPGR